MIEVVEYTPEWADQWDSFVRTSNNGTLFHLQKFLGYHLDREFPWHHLLFLDQKSLIALLPAALMGSTLESPIGASYGSFVTGDLPFEKSLELVDAFAEYCRTRGFERALLTPAPFIYHATISQNIEYALAFRGFQYDKHYVSHALPVPAGDYLPSLQSTARRYVRKYLREREIGVTINPDYDSFYPILLKNKERHRVTPTHSLAELKKLSRLFPDDLVLFLVTKKGKPIAGSLVFRCNQQAALCFYNMLLYDFEQFHPIHAVMYEIVEWARQQGIKWVDLGVSQDTHADDPMTPARSLIRFKEQFNARGILRSTMYKRFI